MAPSIPVAVLEELLREPVPVAYARIVSLVRAADAVEGDRRVYDCAFNNARYAEPCDRCPIGGGVEPSREDRLPGNDAGSWTVEEQYAVEARVVELTAALRRIDLRCASPESVSWANLRAIHEEVRSALAAAEDGRDLPPARELAECLERVRVACDNGSEPLMKIAFIREITGNALAAAGEGGPVSARDDFQRDLERAGELVRSYDQDGDIEPLVEFANRDTETRAYFAALIARSGSRLPEPEGDRPRKFRHEGQWESAKHDAAELDKP